MKVVGRAGALQLPVGHLALRNPTGALGFKRGRIHRGKRQSDFLRKREDLQKSGVWSKMQTQGFVADSKMLAAPDCIGTPCASSKQEVQDWKKRSLLAQCE